MAQTLKQLFKAEKQLGISLNFICHGDVNITDDVSDHDLDEAVEYAVITSVLVRDYVLDVGRLSGHCTIHMGDPTRGLSPVIIPDWEARAIIKKNRAAIEEDRNAYLLEATG